MEGDLDAIPELDVRARLLVELLLAHNFDQVLLSIQNAGNRLSDARELLEGACQKIGTREKKTGSGGRGVRWDECDLHRQAG
jgi:hypothetical protein